MLSTLVERDENKFLCSLQPLKGRQINFYTFLHPLKPIQMNFYAVYIR